MSSLCQLNFSNPPVPDQIDRFVSLPLISLPLCHFGHGKCVQCLARTIQRTCNTSLNHTRSGLKGNIPQPASVLYLWLSLSSVSSLGLSLSSIFPVPWLQLRGLRRRLRARYAWKLWATLPPFPVDTHTASCVSRSTGTSPQPRAPVSVLSADSASPRGPSWPEATCWWRRWRSWGWARLSTLSPCVRKRPPVWPVSRSSHGITGALSASSAAAGAVLLPRPTAHLWRVWPSGTQRPSGGASGWTTTQDSGARLHCNLYYICVWIMHALIYPKL